MRNRFSKTVSVMTLCPATVFITMIGPADRWKSGPGHRVDVHGAVLPGAHADAVGARRVPRLELGLTGRGAAATPRTVTSPRVAAASMNVPASIRSANAMSSVRARTTMRMVSLPAPLTLPPIALIMPARSTISGSLAALMMIVSPRANDAAIMMFSVPPTLGKSR